MTDEEQTILEAFEKIREHSSPLALPYIYLLERWWAVDRLQLQVEREMHALATGGSVLDGNDNHSRRVPPLKGLSMDDPIGSDRVWHA